MRVSSVLLMLVLPPFAMASKPSKNTTLVTCGSYKLITTGPLPDFTYGSPLNNKPSSNDGWAVVDGQLENARAVKFVDEIGKMHDVKMHREIAYQYGKYIILSDVIDIPSYSPCPRVCSTTKLTILRDPKEGTWAGLGPSEYPQCEIKNDF